MATFRIQPHLRLQEWVAEELGLFTDAGLTYEFDTGLAATSLRPLVSSTDSAPTQIMSGAFEDMEKGRSCDVSAACHWAVNAAASADHGKMWGRAYSVCPGGVFVAPESSLQTPEDLAGVPISVGYHSGSHYSTLQALESYLEKSEISFDFAGLPLDRVRGALSGEVAVADVWGGHYYLLEQRGFRKLLDTTFVMGFLLSPHADLADTEKYFEALRRAQQEIDLQPERFKHYWLRELPDDLRAISDVRRFGPGERIVFEPYTREMFERTHRWMESWDLFDATDSPSSDYESAVLV